MIKSQKMVTPCRNYTPAKGCSVIWHPGDIFFLTIGDCQSWYWWIYFSQLIDWHDPVIRAPHGNNSYGQTGPWTPIQTAKCVTSLCLFSRHAIRFSLSTCHSVCTHSVAAVKASSSERQTEGEKYGAVGATQEACQCPARVLDFASICHSLTPSLALTGQGSGSLWRMTNLPSVMNETPPPECQEGADGEGGCLTGNTEIMWWMVCRQDTPGLCQASAVAVSCGESPVRIAFPALEYSASVFFLRLQLLFALVHVGKKGKRQAHRWINICKNK